MTIESVDRILSLLPGVDCGGCGYPTCKACAQAIAESASITLCPATNTETTAAIAKILNVEPVIVKPKIAHIKCAGHASGKSRFKEIGCKTCANAKKSGFEKDECLYGCIGLGSCIEKCKFGAMSVSDGQVVIDREKCTGCTACVTGCIQDIIEMIPADATNFIPCSSKNSEKETTAICNFGCIGCGDCVIACPKNAIEMICGDQIDGRYAKINYDLCEGCLSCTVNCRKKIIIDTHHDLKKVKEKVAMVRCTGGNLGHEKLKAIGFTGCREIVQSKTNLDELNVCEYSCLGFGDCMTACRFGAISNDAGIAKVNNTQCVGCGDCIRTCPQNKIELIPYIGIKQAACQSEAKPERRQEICLSGCIGCGDCAENCPNNAIEMIQGYPNIDHDKCVNCGICSYVCSRGLIRENIVPEYIYRQRQAMTSLNERSAK